MVTCLLCTSPRSIGALCTSHGVAIASPGITSEQIFSRVQNGSASLIDSWGCAHAIADGSKIGRDPKVEVVITIQGEDVTIRGELKIDEKANPKTIDWIKFKNRRCRNKFNWKTSHYYRGGKFNNRSL